MTLFQLNQTQIFPHSPFFLLQIAESRWHTRLNLCEHLRLFHLSVFIECFLIYLFSCFEIQTDGGRSETIPSSLCRQAGRAKQTRTDSVTGDVILQSEHPRGSDPMMQHSGDSVKQVASAAAFCIQNC